jgi:dTDP-4-dehydrorhamnose reductase
MNNKKGNSHMSTLFITGARGQVAFDLQAMARLQGHAVYAFDRDELDISDALRVQEVLQRIRPDVVINLAAYTHVDRAETEHEMAFRVNRDGAKHLAIACQTLQCPLLHLSTDYVFNGESNTPYRETDLASPLSIYGQSKWEGEEAIRMHCENHMIIRVSAIFGVHGINFVKTMLRLMETRDSLRVVVDQITCPTPSLAIAMMLLEVAQRPTPGTYHFCGKVPTSWYHFASFIAEAAALYFPLKVKTIEAIPSVDYPAPAKRPRYSVLDCSHLNKTYGIMPPDWKEGCLHVIKTLSAS